MCSHELAVAIRAVQDLAKVPLIHSVNALTWPDYLRRVGQDGLQGVSDIWLDQSDMAIEAAVQGAGVIIESRVLASAELDNGKLVVLFDEERHSFDVTTYCLVKARKQHRTNQVNAFERWLKTAVDGYPHGQ